MEGRQLSIIAPIQTDEELQSNPIIQKINTIIEFINNNRCRMPAEKDNEYKQKNPRADMRKDIELREKIARELSNPANVMGMYQQVQNAMAQRYQKNSSSEHVFASFKLMADEFFSHIQFVHLTAVELAMVGVVLDTLLILLYQARMDLHDDAAVIAVLNKQNELLRIRDSVVACMAYHKKIFESNIVNQEKDEFYYSDIIANLFSKIEMDAGINLGDERKDLWPDMSYLQILPEMPFYKSIEPQSVAQYFDHYIRSTPPGIDDIGQLTDELRQELNLLDGTEEVPLIIMGTQKSESDEVPAGAGCFTWLWPRASAGAHTPAVSSKNKSWILDSEDEFGDASAHGVKQYALDDVIRLLENFNSKKQEQFEKMELEHQLRVEMANLKIELQNEIDRLQQPGCLSCFAFFWSGAMHKKLVKKAALEYVLSASTLEELGQRAGEKLHDGDRETICAGWRSRTESMLNRVVDVVAYQTGIRRASFDLL